MSKVKFKLNLKGLNALMKSSEMQSVLNKAAESVQTAAGEGYKVEAAHAIPFVAIASVRTGDFKSRKDNSDNNTLLKAAGSARI